MAWIFDLAACDDWPPKRRVGWEIGRVLPQIHRDDACGCQTLSPQRRNALSLRYHQRQSCCRWRREKIESFSRKESQKIDPGLLHRTRRRPRCMATTTKIRIGRVGQSPLRRPAWSTTKTRRQTDPYYYSKPNGDVLSQLSLDYLYYRLQWVCFKVHASSKSKKEVGLSVQLVDVDEDRLYCYW